LIKQDINAGKRILIFDTDRIEWTIIDTKRAGQPQGEALGCMKPLSRRSWSWIFSLANLFGGIRYDLSEIGVVPG
jgi:hypothetical protein